MEGVLWLVLKKKGLDALLPWLTFGYLTFAYSLWPILCSTSVHMIEYNKKRRKMLRRLILLGTATSFYLLFFIILHPSYPIVLNCNIRYQTFVAGVH